MAFEAFHGIDGSVAYARRPDEPSEAQKRAWNRQLFLEWHNKKMRKLLRQLGARRFKIAYGDGSLPEIDYDDGIPF